MGMATSTYSVGESPSQRAYSGLAPDSCTLLHAHSPYNDGDVDVGGLLDSLGVGAGVGDDDQAGLPERTGDVVGEVTRSETTSDGGGAGVGSELEDGTLSVGTGRDDTDCAVSVKKELEHICATFKSRCLDLGAQTYHQPGCRWRQ